MGIFKRLVNLAKTNLRDLADTSAEAAPQIPEIDDPLQERFAELEKQDRRATYFEEGNERYLAGDFEAAAAIFQEAVRLFPDDADLWCNLGNALDRLGELESAEEAMRQAVCLNPQDPVLHYNLANILRRAEPSEEAVDAYREAIRLKPDYGLAMNNLGDLLIDLGRWDEAKEVLHEAHAKHLEPALVCNTLAILYYQQDQTEVAIDWLKRSLEADPGNVRVQASLARLLDEQAQSSGN